MQNQAAILNASGGVDGVTPVDLARGIGLPAEVREQTLFDYVPIAKMFVAQYGRPFSPRKVTEMRKNFNPKAIGVLYLSMRANDTYAVIDGQHRMVVSMEHGLTELPARVYIDLTYEQEAALYNAFATVNKQGALDRFRAKIEMDDAESIAIRAVFQKLNMDIALQGPKEGQVQAVQAVETIYKRHGLGFLGEIAQLLHDAWGEAPRAWTANMLTGMAAFWVRYREDPKLDRKRLVDKLMGIMPTAVVARSHALQSVMGRQESHNALGITIFKLYNDGLRVNRLDPWQQAVYTEAGLERVVEGSRRGIEAIQAVPPEEKADWHKRAWATRRAREQAEDGTNVEEA